MQNKNLTDKDFINGNPINSESLKGEKKFQISSSDTHQVLLWDDHGNRVTDNYKGNLRKDSFGRIYKRCNKCKEWKLIIEFPSSSSPRAAAGVGSLCNYCLSSSEYSKEKRLKPIEESSEEKEIEEAIKREELLYKCTDQELANELRRRGYKGKLTISKDLIIGE